MYYIGINRVGVAALIIVQMLEPAAVGKPLAMKVSIPLLNLV